MLGDFVVHPASGTCSHVHYGEGDSRCLLGLRTIIAKVNLYPPALNRWGRWSIVKYENRCIG